MDNINHEFIEIVKKHLFYLINYQIMFNFNY